MRFRFFQLSPQAQRWLSRWRSRLLFWVVFYPSHLVASAVVHAGHLLTEWWHHRNLLYLLQGLPALALFVGLLTLGAVVAGQDRGLLADDYHIQAHRSVAEAGQLLRSNKDAKPALAMAQTCYLRLGVLQPEKVENRYGQAQVLELLKQPAAADAVLRSIAPADRPGYGPAHLWLADKIWAALQAPPAAGEKPRTAELLRAYERHLLHALQWKTEPVTTEAHKRLYNLYRQTSRLPEAEKELALAAERVPELRLDLAGWNLAQGKKDQAQRNAQAAAQAFRKRLDDNDTDHVARAGLIRCDLMTGDYAAAQELAQRGIALANEKPELLTAYRVELARVLVAWYDAKTADPKSAPAERFALLEQVMAIFPDSPDLLQRLVTFIRQTGPEGEKVRQKFRDLTAEGKPSAVAHLVLGTDAWQRDKPAEARYHWEKALQLSPGTPQVANNLAWVLAHYPPVDVDRALSLIDAALKQVPGDPRLHGTRGHILAKLDRHKEALEELEIAKVAYPNDAKLFRQLAESCAKLSLDKMAADYKQRAEALAVKAPAPNPPTAGPDTKPSAPDSPPASEPKGSPAPADPKP
jgi:tetratricopeptide (TPR) repeat protein